MIHKKDLHIEQIKINRIEVMQKNKIIDDDSVLLSLRWGFWDITL